MFLYVCFFGKDVCKDTFYILIVKHVICAEAIFLFLFYASKSKKVRKCRFFNKK